MKAILILGWVGLALAAPVQASAAALPELVRALDEDMSLADAAVASAGSVPAEEAWLFRRFWLRVRPKVGVGIGSVLKVEIAPEAEMLWERDLPEGWVTYKP
jgi:hypothetical protein